MSKILIIGCGDIGGALAGILQKEGHDVTGVKRTALQKEYEYNAKQLDVSDRKAVDDMSFDYDQILYILSPSDGSIAAYRSVFGVGVANILRACKLQGVAAAITFVSSTRVYAQQRGEWVDEVSNTEPIEERGLYLLGAEKQFLSFNEKTTIVRFSGIYGRSNYLLNQLKSGAPIQKEPVYYTNRIHRDDCIGVLQYILNKKDMGDKMYGVFIATDNDPASKWEVGCYLAELIGLDAPTPLLLDNASKANKRITNKRLTNAGYVFKYPSYREGYKVALDD